LLRGDRVDTPDCGVGTVLLGGQERDPGGVPAGRRQREGDLRAQQRVGHLDKDAGAVAAGGVGARRTTVLEVREGGEGLVDDVPAAAAVHVDDEGDAARVVLVRRVVQAGAAWLQSHRRSLLAAY